MSAADGYTLRVMTEADIDAVWALEQELFPEDAWPRRMFQEELAHSQTRRFWVAEEGGAIIAYCGMMCVLPLADVQTIGVASAFEGRGLGSRLLETLIAEARDRGANDVLLEVRADNPRARQLYLRFGFEQIHVRPRYYKGGIDALIMRKQLENAD
ncbi:ribosomal protein S18-alanine N-acetyltransferase [Paeniglutamicibacter cryotolerans]|uniref:[Ribosomal protein bS18]-alanine N-acetyltransferase n=1 Tax=Paeniglutamicibacter cryotolerans TaxID=670079 RepID=A0A839QCS0_9MICC|nr:ribosomal protein S18-alanine N-acetyltransferase [Paeniglutamicibacter cryotolerans]MBB2993919.1 ribosomal-protein-alanine N-acetyltransferase [Paeniglutamicibacter cryotolerans]